jgi:hypothetical protein
MQILVHVDVALHRKFFFTHMQVVCCFVEYLFKASKELGAYPPQQFLPSLSIENRSLQRPLYRFLQLVSVMAKLGITRLKMLTW